jgi:hypothetical protein
LFWLNEQILNKYSNTQSIFQHTIQLNIKVKRRSSSENKYSMLDFYVNIPV